MNTHRPVVMGTQGMVAAGHHLASLAGIQALQNGGNAFDAAVAAAAAVAVLKPPTNSIGGDCLAVLWNAEKQELMALNANGFAPKSATLDRYKDGIPEHGPLASAIPGAVAGWEAILSRYGTKTLAELMEPSIRFAEQGFPVSHVFHDEISSRQEEFQHWPAAAALFNPGGSPLRPGTILRQPDLARSLKQIASKGARAFYEGEIAQRLGEYMAANGGLIAASDLAAYQPSWADPLHVTYRGVDWYGQPPSSQGFIIGEMLNVLEGYDPAALSEPELIHLGVEAKKLTFADRGKYLADPAFHSVPLEALLSKERAARQRARITATAAKEVPPLDVVAEGGDTTYLCVMDSKGNAVSFIQSVFHPFGSFVIAGDTGILMNNRMLGFSLEAGHPNVVEPRKRPSMTLNACMLFRDSRLWVVYGTPGADAQVQTNVQHAMDWVDFGMDVQTAIESPRWRHLPGDKLLVESRFSTETIEALRAKGHSIVLGGPWEGETGGAQAIMVDPVSGALLGGADPRREGYAIGM